jgi:hypothetical protein
MISPIYCLESRLDPQHTHLPKTWPALSETFEWRGDLLILLENNFNDPANIHAATLHALQHGKIAGKNNFSAIFFSTGHIIIASFQGEVIYLTTPIPFLAGKEASHGYKAENFRLHRLSTPHEVSLTRDCRAVAFWIPYSST